MKDRLPIPTKEEHAAALSNQHLKNLANSLVGELEKRAMPESAQIVRELIVRIPK